VKKKAAVTLSELVGTPDTLTVVPDDSAFIDRLKGVVSVS
jgi:hypothetical protein